MLHYGKLNYNGLACDVFFDEGSKSEIEIIPLGEHILVQGSKNYVILDCSDSEEFTSKIGSIGTLTDYLRGSVPEIELKALWLNSLVPEVLDFDCEKPRSNFNDLQTERNRLELYKLYGDLTLTDLQSRYDSVKFNPEKVVEKNTLKEGIVQTINLRRFADRGLERLKDSLVDAIDEDTDESRIVKAYLQYGFGACFLLTVRSEYYFVPKESLNKAVEYVIRDLKDQDIVIKQRAKQGFHLLIKELAEMKTSDLIKEPYVIKNKKKVQAIIHNAREFQKITKKHGSFSGFLKLLRAMKDEEAIRALMKKFKHVGKYTAEYYLHSVGYWK